LRFFVIASEVKQSQMLIAENNRYQMVEAGSNIRMDYQTISAKKRPTTDNMGIGGALGGFLLTNRPIIFSMTVLKTITTNA
jgi:hypothetical protein